MLGNGLMVKAAATNGGRGLNVLRPAKFKSGASKETGPSDKALKTSR